MFGTIDFPQANGFGILFFGTAVLLSVWWGIYLMCLDHRKIAAMHARGIAEITLSKANAFRAANAAGDNATAIVGLEDKIGVRIDAAVSGGVAAVAADNRDVAATLAGHTPTSGVSLPAELRRVVAAETAKPHTSPD